MSSAPVALLTPMANPTVEREMRQLLPAEVDYMVGRLVSADGDSATRLREYAERLPDMLTQFGGMPLCAVAFACTASSYLIGADGEAEVDAALPIPVLWAARVIRETLGALGAKRIAVISPYPDAIHGAGLGYWQAAGLEIAFESQVDIGSADTRNIYALSGTEAVQKVTQAREAQPDAILLSGTGMPTMALVEPRAVPPIISSNYCLAQAMIQFQESAR